MALLGHAGVKMAMHYTHADLERMRAQMELIGKPNRVN
jgi:hypothetical protein